MKLVLVDADGLCYHALRETLEESIQSLNERIYNIFEKTEATHYVFFISQGKYFRHNIDPLYKQSREKYRNNPANKWVRVLKQYLIAEWNAQWMDSVESDDLIKYWNNKFIYYYSDGYNYFESNVEVAESIIKSQGNIPIKEDVEKIICSPDKDILQSIEGKHFNYTYKLEDKENSDSLIKGWWVETDAINSSFYELEAMIVGDVSDGCKGLKGKGKVFVNKLFDGKNVNEALLLVLDEYKKEYGLSQGIYEFQKSYRLLHILENNEDFMREIGKLPEFPIISEVPKIDKTDVEQIIPEF